MTEKEKTVRMKCVYKPRDAQILVNNLYFSLDGSTCFGLSLVHHQA